MLPSTIFNRYTCVTAARIFRLPHLCKQHASVRDLQRYVCTSCHRLQETSAAASKTSTTGSEGKISRAMKIYLERAKAHENFMTEEKTQFEIGKRHLANIMGEDPDTLTQEQINEAIEYLLPSGLFDKKARPIMKPPEQVIPPRKAAQFGMDGRPFHHMFYTGFPNFYQILFDAGVKLDELKAMEEGGTMIDTIPPLQLSGSEWLAKKEIENLTNERISDVQYEQIIRVLGHVASHPLAGAYKDFIFKFRVMLVKTDVLEERKPIQVDEQGRKYQEEQGLRKEARATVRVFEKGTGKVTINGKQFLEYFPELLDRQQLLFPLQLTNKLNLVDIEAHVINGGHSGQAGAIRHGLSRCLQSFVDEEMIEKMRIAGLLIRNPRERERKKYGQEGARRKFTWKKR